MKEKVRIKGKLKKYLVSSFAITAILFVINIYVYTQSAKAGLAVSLFLLFYLLVAGYFLWSSSSTILYDMVSFATQYGQVQKQLLKELDIAHALLDEHGRIIWTNTNFDRVIGKAFSREKSISAVFPAITSDKLPNAEVNDSEVNFAFEGYEFQAKMCKIPLGEMVESNASLEADADYNGYLIALYLYDNTALKLALRELDEQSLAVGLIYFDNYDEVLESVEEVRRSLLTALIERKVNKYISSLDGITKKIEKDKFLVVLRKGCLTKLKENRFDILEDVKTVNIGNDLAVTLSIGFGVDGLTYAQNYEFARAAIDLALGRGGDQAVVKTPEQMLYYGGKSQQVEKNTRVKARVKAHALMEIISGKDQIFIMGHKMGDVDSFGASIGIYRIARILDKKAHIVLDSTTASTRPWVELFANNPDYESDMILSGQRALEEIGNNAVLVIVDVNKPSLTECPGLFGKCKSVVVLDHHRQGAEPIENATLSYVEPYASSTCEMVSEILQYTTDNVKIPNDEADVMYSGMSIDTDNFNQKTGVRTFEAAAFLKRCGADVARVRKMSRMDANEYRARADAVSQAEIYKNEYAIAVCEADDCESPTIVGAQAANELLDIKGVRGSFVFTYYQNVVYISARSIDEVNVQIIMEKLGGGGHMSAAAAQLSDTNVADAIEKFKGILDTMISEGEI